MMQKTVTGALALLGAIWMPGAALAQDTAAGAPPAYLKAYLATVQADLQAVKNRGDKVAEAAVTARAALADRVATQIAAHPGAYPLAAAPFTYYAVPAISPIKRLPDVFPADGTLGGTLRIVAARNEFEPASFVVFPFTDAARAELKASALSGPGGVLPADTVDLKIVKCWYQGGTAWYSYFADTTGHVLVPELLLNDETLIKVDTATKENYLRVDYPAGPRYVWISNPLFANIPFNAETEPVADAKTLQPFQLAAGEFKQFWVTVHVPKDAAPGVYRGTIELMSGSTSTASIPLSVSVLPFELPKPMTNYDPDREFYTMLYNEPQYGDILKANGGDKAQAERKMLAIFRNMRTHNMLNPKLRDYGVGAEATFTRQLELLKQAGLSTDPIFGIVPGIPDYGWMKSDAVKSAASVRDVAMPEGLKQRIDEASALIMKLFGHSNVYCVGWDEPGRDLVIAERRPWKYIHEKGLKVYSTGHESHLKFSGYNEDFINAAGTPTRDHAEKWHAFGARITTYAGPHTGPENPDYMRRVHGLQLYKANYDGIGNYMLSCSHWNDFVGEEYNFRRFNMTYPTRDGVIDTIEWEGIREAVDDVRYATRLKQLANQAIATGKVEAVYAGRKALQWLAMVDEDAVDLDAARLEMINTIMKLNDVL
jgi:hypothetical protein